MAGALQVLPSPAVRVELAQRGAETAGRCYQCATCSSVCELAPANAPFPRRQILWAQWGMEDRLMGDAGAWLCHQCNDCSVRCPRGVDIARAMEGLRQIVLRREGAVVNLREIDAEQLADLPQIAVVGASRKYTL